MFERFDETSGTVVEEARAEARRLGATRLEAEHLLLALARQTATEAGRVLAEAGLDHDRLRDALDAERLRSLEAIGVTPGAVAIAERPLPAAGTPRWGASAKRAIQRTMEIVKARGDRRILPTHLLLGTLGAREGTVPRTLAAVGVDPRALAERAEAALGEPR
ncbi:MAG TPA: Clp protease N-terminal domain-containing protein [Actinomycetota bacterium]|jgi:ATP-dependent Clp protease ATP-binding subunit ClpA